MTKHDGLTGLNQQVENDLLNYQDFSAEDSSAAGVKRWAILEGLARLPPQPGSTERAPAAPLPASHDRVSLASSSEASWRPEQRSYERPDLRPVEPPVFPPAYNAPSPPWQGNIQQAPVAAAPQQGSQAFGHLFRRSHGQDAGQPPAAGTSLKALLKRIGS